jgi:D-alanyl-D-alanine carboxypeptidase/D-alanyl-D-alanine-endopeptidase (penicillin-binding protein 4)
VSALLLCLWQTGCADVQHLEDGDGAGPDDGDDSSDDGAPAPPVEADAFEPPPPPLALPDEVIAAAADQVSAIIASTAFTHSVLIENATTGQLVAGSNADALLKPASNTKLYTTAAAMEILGADHGLTTRVAADAPPDGEGVIAGDLHIVLEHDFTLSSDLYDGPRQPLDRIAQALARLGVTRVDGTVQVSGEPVFEGNSIGTLDLATERAETTDAMAAALADAGIAAASVTSSAALDLPEGAALLVDHAPLSLVAGASPLNTDSNNEFADVLIRHLGWLVEGESSAGAGTRAVLEWLASTGVSTEGVELHDGSGLSHDNRVSARTTVGLLGFMDTSPVGTAWSRTLAIAGVRGTLGNRMVGEDTAGRVFGKTGTLRDTITLSGFVENRHDGQRYRFSVLWNEVDDAATARALADQIVEVVAGNLRGSGARLPAPRLQLARATGSPGVLELAWSEVEGADGYLVWTSEDGRTWPREAARHVRQTHFLAGDLSAAQATHVRVSARAADGLESDPSAAYAATASGERAAILLVDGNDVWSSPAAENSLGRDHDFLAVLAASAGERTVDSAHHGAVESGEVDLAAHDVVVWAAGEESTMTVALTPAEREHLAAHVGAGRALIVSGAELVWALADQGDADEQAFVADVLGAVYVGDDAGTYEAEGVAGDAAGDFAALPLLSFLAPDGMDILFPDVIAPGDGGVELMRYVGGTEGGAAIGHAASSGRRVVVTGFPIEALPGDAARTALLGAALRFVEP